ncbi:MAG: hypothetical protein D6790_18040 [Caldilineae bacterium]|nr:MAG: hypothetical protein D6790_18040 [Caldilineae bacterium]
MMRRLLPLAILLAATTVLVLAVDGFLRQVIVEPLLYVGWVIGVVITSLPQAVFWGLFLLLALVLALRSLSRGKPPPPLPRPAREEFHGPVVTWLHLLERGKSRRFGRWNLAQSLRRLTFTLLQPDDPYAIHPEQAGPVQPDLPPEIEAYFNARLPPVQSLGWRWLLQQAQRTPPGPLDLDPETVIAFLEEETIEHGHPRSRGPL